MIDLSFVTTSLLFILSTALLVCFIKIYWSFSYFSKRNIPYEKPKSVFGSGKVSSSLPLLLWDIHKKSGQHKVYGFFILWKPSILIKDLEIIKEVLVKNFSSFYDRGVYFDEKTDPLSGHLFSLEGETWKKLRAKMSPAFTSGRMKLMFPTILNFSDTLVTYISEKPATESLECFKLMAKFTLSNIASTAFGIESDLFKDDSKFMEIALKFNTPSLEQLIRSFMLFHLRDFARLLNYKFASSETNSFYLNLVSDAVSYREKNNIVRNDFLQMLIQLKNKGTIDGSSDDGSRLTLNQISAQAFVFILAGFDTSAVAQSWTLYELALNPEVQRRLQQEVDTVKDWTFENIHGLEYLDMVLSETLRKYPSVPFLIRRSNNNFKVPGSDIVIEKGSDVSISVWGLHRDPHLFPDPDRFDPERFGSNPTHEVKPYSYLPFGEGPRFCIGMRFAKMQTKVGIAKLMKHYTVEPSEKTQIPAELHPKAIQAMAKNGVWLRFKKRTEK